MKTAALVIADPAAGRLGHARRLDGEWRGMTTLGMTLRRVAETPGLGRVFVLHPAGTPLPQACQRDASSLDAQLVAVDVMSTDAQTAATRRVRRSWTLDGWRGGLGGATVWDELLPVTPIAEVAKRFGLDAVLLVGGDWPLVDPALSAEMFAVHRSAPEAMKLCFSQAPPGLSGIVVARSLLEDMADTGSGFSDILAYQPKRPAVDPISMDFNVAIPAPVRDMARRFISDTSEAVARTRAVLDLLGDRWLCADATEITQATRAWERDSLHETRCFLPPQVVVELTPRRLVDGPITPQHHADITRPDMTPGLLERLAPQLAGLTVTLGGLGDPLLHGEWASAITRLKNAGAMTVALETDLLTGDAQTLEQLTQAILDAAPDAVLVHLNAEDAQTYQQEMGGDHFSNVMAAIQQLFNRRGIPPGVHGLPAIVPMLTKTEHTTPQLETFFERWWQLARHAVVQRFSTGGKGSFALAPDRNPVPMDGPWREPDPHQRKQRLTVWSNGDVSLCHHDWLGRATLGNIADATLLELWQGLPDLNLDPVWSPDDSPMCRRCFDFARLHAQQRESACA